MKKLIFLIVFLISLTKISLFFPKLTYALNEQPAISGNQWYVQPSETWTKNILGAGPNGEQYFLFAWSNMLNNVAASAQGVKVTTQGPNGPIYTYQGGAINILGDLTGALYNNRPASSVEYLANLGQNMGIVKPVMAQGIGFSAFSPVLSIWKAFRDLAYLGFVIIFVVVGFMIMFRKKIDPRTVVTVQEALPRIVIALILITFSYAISGLIIDAGDFLTRFIGSTLSRSELIAVSGSDIQKQKTLNDLYGSNIFALVNPLRSVDGLINALGTMGEVPLMTDMPFDLGKLTIRVIFVIAAFFIMFKIFFALLGPYVGIVLSVIFAPFILLPSAIPGSTSSFTSWLRGLLANVLVFPVTFAMLAIAAALKGSTPEALGRNAIWDVGQPNYTLGWSPAIIGQWGSAVGHLLAFGILFTIPKVVEIVQSLLQVKPEPWAATAGTEIKGAASSLPIIGGFISKQM